MMELVKKKFILNETAFDCFVVIRMVDGVEQFLFKAFDVATFLGYKLPRKAIYDHVQKESKLTWGKLTANSSVFDSFFPQANWPPNTIFITESGLHSLIVKSRLFKAFPFKKWLYREVLPSIRSTGKYNMNILLKDENYEMPTEKNITCATQTTVLPQADILPNDDQEMTTTLNHIQNSRQFLQNSRQFLQHSQQLLQSIELDL